MTQMGLDYQKLRESQRHNFVSEDVSRREVAAREREASVKEYTASFEPRRVAATERQAGASERMAEASMANAATNTYLASFEPRRIASSERQSRASQLQAAAASKQASVQAARYNLDASWRSYEEGLKAQELEVRSAANAINKYIAQLNALPTATKANLAAAGLDLDSIGTTMTALETGFDKGMSIFNAIISSMKSLMTKTR